MLLLASVSVAGGAEDAGGQGGGVGLRAGEDVPAVGAAEGEDAETQPVEGGGKRSPLPGETFRLDRLIFDSTGALTPVEIDRIQLKAERFIHETSCPLVVVVVGALSEAGNLTGDAIATACTLLSQHVRDMESERAKRAWLMLISLDGYVRIQKGPVWGNDVAASIQEIIDTIMVPRLSRRDPEGHPKKRELAEAILAGIGEMTSVLYHHRIAHQPVIGDSIDRFAAKSWLWILLGLHMLGFLYVICTKESEGWYVAALLFGLPILLAMLIFVLQGEEERAVVERAHRRLGDPGELTDGGRSTVWGFW